MIRGQIFVPTLVKDRVFASSAALNFQKPTLEIHRKVNQTKKGNAQKCLFFTHNITSAGEQRLSDGLNCFSRGQVAFT